MEKREGSTPQTDQNLVELAGSVQGCKLAGTRPSGGEPHDKTESTSTFNLGLANDYNSLKLPNGDTIRFGRVDWTGSLERCQLTRGVGI